MVDTGDIHRSPLLERIAELEAEVKAAIEPLTEEIATLSQCVINAEGQRDNVAAMLRRLMYKTRDHEETKALWDEAHDLMKRMGCAPTFSSPGPDCPKCRLPLSAHSLGECP